MSKRQRFGDPSRFAIDMEFLPDPHNGRGASPAQAASWGAFRLWVRGRNLCEHRAQDALHDAATWYLLPFLTWLAENWDPLFHEQRLPEAMQPKSARHAYLGAVRATLGDPDPQVEHRAIAWQQWWERHGLRSCREGGLFPDIFIRRLLDFVELSWGNQDLPGAPGDFYFTAPSDTQYLDVAEAAEPLYQALRMALDHLEQAGIGGAKEVASFRDSLARLARTPPVQREAWYLYSHANGTERHTDLRAILERSAAKASGEAKALFESSFRPLYLEHLSPAVAMFGSASLSIEQADADFLAQRLLNAYAPEGEPAELTPLIQAHPLSEMRVPYEEGYDLALDLLDEMELPGAEANSIDLYALLGRLRTTVSEIVLVDDSVRGVALAGGDIQPTILINTSHPMNQKDSGRRFTLAHELCHILHDRGYGRRLSLISGPWAPAGVERRANAFAAMLLMPPVLVNRHVSDLECTDIASVEVIETLADKMGAGFMATFEHLTNLGKLDEGQRERIREAAWRRVGFDG